MIEGSRLLEDEYVFGHRGHLLYKLIVLYTCVCSQQLLPVVLVGTPKHAMSPVRFVLDLLEEVRRAEDAHQAGRREAWTQPQQPGTHTHTHTYTYTHTHTHTHTHIHTYIHFRSKVWGHPDNFVSYMKTHFYLSNELKIE